jgi:type I restriction-modification system DNA methylase subunit
METVKEGIVKLVEKYDRLKKENKIKDYNEAQTRNEFIEPLFEILGWDMRNLNNEREVITEENISGKRIDLAFRINGISKFFLEAKSMKSDLDVEDYTKQAIRYSWNKGITYAVLTDFESIKIFNAQAESKLLLDKLIFEIPCHEYISDFERLWLLSKESFSKNALDTYSEKHGKKLKKLTVNEKLLLDFKTGREMLTESFSRWNRSIDEETLDEGVQRILDRLVFIRVLEDRELEDPILRPLVRDWENDKIDRSGNKQFFHLLIDKFRELDGLYNSNLFTKHACEDWEEYDDAVKDVINLLYGNDVYAYDFKHIPADILGGVYESYLGYIGQNPINEGHKKGKLFDLDDKNEIKIKSRQKRKEHGIYYTPRFIVDYIVKNTLGEKLKEIGSMAELKKIRVLDPACGSGSFLTRALEEINNKYKDFGNPGKQDTKTEIVSSNIYGVDLDAQATELAKLNLLIDTLDEKAKLPSIKNVRVGNSLISGDEKKLKKYFGKNWQEKKPFNWEKEFPEVFAQGGFDVITGNPPWGANIDDDLQFYAEKYPNSTKEKKDIYKIFIEKSISLLNPNGVLGFIIPNSFLYQPSYEDVKNLINQYNNLAINLGEKIFKNVTVPCCILILNKQKNPSNMTIDFVKEERVLLPNKLLSLNLEIEKGKDKYREDIIKKTDLNFGDVFELKDAGIQYHRSGIGLSNKGGSDLYERIFCKDVENKFKESKETYYGKLMQRYYISNKTDELFNLNYKDVLNKNESVSFTKNAFEQNQKIIWRQTAPTIFATLDEEKRWFRNTIQCGWVKDEYKSKVDLVYSLAIFNSSYMNYVYRQKVLETGRIFPQVKIKYLQMLPFIIGTNNQQKALVLNAKKMLELNKQIQKIPENSDKWNSIKAEISKTDKEIDQKVYELYGLTEEEIKIIEGEK